MRQFSIVVFKPTIFIHILNREFPVKLTAQLPIQISKRILLAPEFLIFDKILDFVRDLHQKILDFLFIVIEKLANHIASIVTIFYEIVLCGAEISKDIFSLTLERFFLYRLVRDHAQSLPFFSFRSFLFHRIFLLFLGFFIIGLQ